MTHHEEHGAPSELTPEELEAEGGEELPDREAMSLINANVAAPVNPPCPRNVLSHGAAAYATREQTQHTDHTQKPPPRGKDPHRPRPDRDQQRSDVSQEVH